MGCKTCGSMAPGEYDPKDLSADQLQDLHEDGLPEGYGAITGDQRQSLGLDPKFCSIQVSPSFTMWNGEQEALR